MADPTPSCAHDSATLVRTIKANGDSAVWRRCDDCEANANGHGRWIAHHGIADVEALPVVDDLRLTVPPCQVCGARGVELHHWAPREAFGAEADLWPTAYLCRSCHGRWHVTIARTILNRAS